MSSPDHLQRICDEQGNLITFEQIYEANFQKIFHYILYRVVDVSEAEELTSQTFFKALNALWRYRWSGLPVSSWLYRIATNEVNNLLRNKVKGRFSSIEGYEMSADKNLPHESLAALQQEVLRQKLFVELQDCIQSLKLDEQALITLRFFEQKAFAEIAQILGKRVGAVTMKTHRALEKLQLILVERGFDYERVRGTFEECPQTTITTRIVQARVAP